MARLGPSFHRTFALNRAAMVQILRVVEQQKGENKSGRALSFDLISESTTLGPVYIAAMRRYAFACGLLDRQEHLTPFGEAAIAHDPNLQASATCWVMHYYISCAHGAGPSFWGEVVVRRLRTGDQISREELARDISQQGEDEIAVSSKIAGQSATVFLGSYAKPEGLSVLGVLEPSDDGTYLVKEPARPSLWVFAYVLAEYWQANWPEMVGVSISRLSEPGGLASLLLMGSGSVNRFLGELQSEGFAVVQRRVPPFQINRNWASPAKFLEKLYDN